MRAAGDQLNGDTATVLSTPVTLSAATYDAMWAGEQLDVHHPALSVSTATRGDDDQPARAAGELDRAGLLDGHRVSPELIDTLRLIARPRVEFYGWITCDPDRQISAVVAANSLEPGADAVLAVLDGDTVTLRPVRADTAARALTGCLPDVPAGRGQTITLPESAITRDGDPAPTATSEDPPASVFCDPIIDSPADRLSRLLREPRTGAGQLYTAARSKRRKRQRNPTPIAYIDTSRRGRWLSTTQPNHDGTPWIIATPATPDLLAQRLHTAYQQLNT